MILYIIINLSNFNIYICRQTKQIILTILSAFFFTVSIGSFPLLLSLLDTFLKKFLYFFEGFCFIDYKFYRYFDFLIIFEINMLSFSFSSICSPLKLYCIFGLSISKLALKIICLFVYQFNY